MGENNRKSVHLVVSAEQNAHDNHYHSPSLSPSSPSHQEHQEHGEEGYHSLPSHDSHLSTLRLFWYLLWILLAEFFFLFSNIINYTILTSIAEGHHEENHTPMVKRESNDDKVASNTPPHIAILYFLPSCVVIVVTLAVLVARKRNYWVRKALYVVLILAVLAGLAGEGYALYRYITAYSSDEACEEFEGWTVAVTHTLYAVLALCPIPYRIAMAVAVKADITRYEKETHRNESVFSKEPVVAKWRFFIFIFDALITGCCMPKFFRDIKNTTAHTRHIQHHVVQLIYEIILLIIAVVEHKYIELMAIVAGLLGSMMGLGKIHMLDSIFNLFALLTGLFLLGNGSAKISCGNGDIEQWIYLFLFSLIASTIRFKSFVHTFIETRMQIYHWVMAQLDWIIDEMETPRKMEKRVFHIPNFLTLRKYGDTHGHKEEEENRKRLESERKALLPQENVVPLSTKAKLLIVSLILGSLIVITFSVTMPVLLPTYKVGGQVDGIMKWKESNCTLYSSINVYDNKRYKYLYYYYVTNPQGENLIALPVELRYPVNDNRLMPINHKFTALLHKPQGYPCRIPDPPLFANITLEKERELDFSRKNPIWKQVTLLTSDDTLKKLKTNYYAWIIAPPIALLLGLVMVIGPIVVCVRNEKTSK